MSWKCPFIVISYNRPDYLLRCLGNITRSKDFKEFKPGIVVVQDKADLTAMNGINRVLDKFRPHIKVVRTAGQRMGCHKNCFRARLIAFEEYKFPRAAFVQDDCLIGHYWYRIMNRALDWAEKNKLSIAAMSSQCECTLSHKRKEEMADLLQDNTPIMHNVVVDRKIWHGKMPVLCKAYYLLSQHPIAIQKLRKWMHDRLADGPNFLPDMGKEYQYSFTKRLYRSSPGEDEIFELFLRYCGWHRFADSINRVVYIGRHGVHTDPNWFAQQAFAQTELYNVPSDADRTEFQLHPRWLENLKTRGTAR
jgi:hypothetical protein